MLENNEELLFNACKSGDSARVEELLAMPGIDPTANDNCAFRSAAEHNHVEVMKLLLRIPAVMKNASLISSIFYAKAAQGSLDTVNLLMNLPIIKQDALGVIHSFKKSVLHGHLEIANMLLSHFSVIEHSNSIREFSWEVINTGQPNIVEYLLDQPDINSVLDKTAVFNYAAEKGHVGILKFMSKRSDIQSLLNKNEAFKRAASAGQREVMEFLLNEHGVDPAIDNNYAIQMAARRDHLSIVEWLLTMPSVTSVRNSLDMVLLAATKSAGLPILKSLLAISHVNPAVLNNACIKKAAQFGCPEAMELLLAQPGVDPTVDNNFPIQVASELGRLEIVELLLARPGVDPTANNNHAIRHAAKNGHVKVVHLLLNRFVDPTACDNYAFKHARKNGHLEVMKLLLTVPAVIQHICMNNQNFQDAIKNSPLEIVTLLLATPTVMQSTALMNQAFREIAVFGCLSEASFDSLPARKKQNNETDRNRKPKKTVMNNHYWEVMKLLLPCVDPAANDNYVIRHAAVENNLRSMVLLLADDRVDPTTHGNFVFRHAIKKGYLPIVKQLLATPSFRKNTQIINEVFQRIAIYGCLNALELPPVKLAPFKVNGQKGEYMITMDDHYLEVLKLLIADPCVNPAANDNYVFQYAAVENNRSAVNLLLADNRVDPTANDNFVFQYTNFHLYSRALNDQLLNSSRFMRAFLAHPGFEKICDSMGRFERAHFNEDCKHYTMHLKNLREKTESKFFLNDEQNKKFNKGFYFFKEKVYGENKQDVFYKIFNNIIEQTCILTRIEENINFKRR